MILLIKIDNINSAQTDPHRKLIKSLRKVMKISDNRWGKGNKKKERKGKIERKKDLKKCLLIKKKSFIKLR